MAYKTLFSIALSLLFLFINATAFSQSNRISREQYIETYKDWAIKDMQKTGIPASIKLAQGILESGNGNSKLAIEANNHFGIKCHEWDGERVFHHDDARNECFRKYANPLQSFEDHSTFLTSRPRYSKLFELATTDYKGWAHGLREAGYATNPQYAQLLIRIIEESELYLLDQNISETARRSNRESQRRQASSDLVINIFEKRPTEYNNGVKYVQVREGDTFESLTSMFGLKAWELPHYNDLPSNADISAYSFLYIESKRKNAHPDHSVHTVKTGDSMHEISQMYGIRLKRLYYLNRMEPGSEPSVGDRLNLRRRVKK